MRLRRILAAAGLAAFGAALPALGGAPALEAWLLPFQLALGLVAGATGALLIGHALAEDWLVALRPALEPLARLAPAVALLAVPLLLAPQLVFPWAADPALAEGTRAAWFSRPAFVLRVALLLGALMLAAALLLRRRGGPAQRAAALALWLPAAMLLPQDLVLSRDMAWFGSLQGTALVLEQVAAALALAVLVAARRGGLPQEASLRGADRALLLLAMLTMWLWFAQFVVVWMADLPGEAAWYLRRDGGWAALKLLLLGMLGAAILLAVPPGAGLPRLRIVAALLLAQHAGHVAWLLRPDAPSGAPPVVLDLLATPVLLAGLAAWRRGALSVRRAPAASRPHARATAR